MPTKAEMRAASGMWWDRAWSLVEGCTPVSAGCAHCWSAAQTRMRACQKNPKIRGRYEGLVNDRGCFNGKVRLMRDALDLPLRTRKPTRWAIWNDLFHDGVPNEFIAAVFGVMAVAEQHTFCVLTKRLRRALKWFRWLDEDRPLPGSEASRRDRNVNDARLTCVWEGWRGGMEYKGDWLPPSEGPWPLPNVHLGVSVEDQATADERIPILLQIPAAVRFVSLEPLLSAVDLRVECDDCGGRGDHGRIGYGLTTEGLRGRIALCETCHGESVVIPKDLHGIILGGETGPGARPMERAWAESVVSQCRQAGIPVFVKQLGAAYSDAENGIAGRSLRVPKEAMGLISRRLQHPKGADMAEWPKSLRLRELPKERRIDR